MAGTTSSTQNQAISSSVSVFFLHNEESLMSAATGHTVGSQTLVSESCPPGLESLHVTDTLYLKPYSGPKVIAHVTRRAVFEILNSEGERIYMITNSISSLKFDSPVEERKSKYGFHMIVKNHFGQDVFEYFGNTGQLVKAGAPGGTRSWGIVSRHWKSAGKCYRCQCRCEGCTKNIAYDVLMYPNTGIDTDDPKTYWIKGHKKSTLFPSSETKKLYYGTFECDIAVKFPVIKHGKDNPDQPPEPEEAVKIGRLSSNIFCGNLGTDLPGIVFPRKMNVHHKAVLFGTLLVNAIKT